MESDQIHQPNQKPNSQPGPGKLPAKQKEQTLIDTPTPKSILPSNPKKSKKGLVIGIAIALVLLVAATICALLLMSKVDFNETEKVAFAVKQEWTVVKDSWDEHIGDEVDVSAIDDDAIAAVRSSVGDYKQSVQALSEDPGTKNQDIEPSFTAFRSESDLMVKNIEVTLNRIQLLSDLDGISDMNSIAEPGEITDSAEQLGKLKESLKPLLDSADQVLEDYANEVIEIYTEAYELGDSNDYEAIIQVITRLLELATMTEEMTANPTDDSADYDKALGNLMGAINTKTSTATAFYPYILPKTTA